MNALYHPEMTVVVKVNKKFSQKLASRVYPYQLIKTYQVSFELLNNYKFEIHGRAEDVRRVKELIDAEIRSTDGPDDVAPAAAAAVAVTSSTITNKEDEDKDSVICLSDPYEAFDEEDDAATTRKKKTNARKQTKTTTTATKREPEQPSTTMQHDDSVILIDDNRFAFSKAALAQGFTSKQVNQVCDELNDKINSISESQFIQMLKNKFKVGQKLSHLIPS